MAVNNKILILGIGNTLRGDDGVGPRVCDEIEAMKLANVTTQKVQLLQTELLEQMIAFDRVLIVDAGVNISEVFIEPVEGTALPQASSHHSNPVIFKLLAKQLHGIDLQIFTCAIPAQRFDLGEPLSEFAKQNTDEAVKLIKDWCKPA